MGQVRRPSAPTYEAFHEAADWGELVLRPITDPPLLVAFKLKTSWISEQGEAGIFRYRISATAKRISGDQLSTYIRRLHRCIFSLRLLDADKFSLKSVEVPFSLGVDEEGKVVSLNVNSSESMNVHIYRSLLEGGWSMSLIDGSCD